MNPIKCTDIRVFFRSSCCNTKHSSETQSPKKRRGILKKIGRTLVRAMHPDSNNLYYQYLKTLEEGNTMRATTITIGNKRYGRLSSLGQYQQLKKAIKAHIPYHGDTKYYYTFEYQKNGNLHAHGIEVSTYQSRFIESFSKFGSRNSHDASFQHVRNLEKYFKYITKECSFPSLTNIMKKDLHTVKGHSSLKDPEEGSSHSTE